MFIKKIEPALQEELESNNIEIAHDYQKKWISRIKSGGDLIAVAPAESGKTTSYMVLLIQQLKRAVEDVPRAMIVCATKDEVIATQEKLENLSLHTDLRIHIGFEGADIQKQKDKIYFGTDIVVGTPRRITELMSLEGINFANLKLLIIDDGQDSMKHTSLSQINRIAESLVPIQKVIFTTQNTVNIKRFAGKFMKNTMEIVGEKG